MENETRMRRFVVVRKEDETGISGVGIVAEGVVFWDGTCVIKWTTDTSSLGIYKSHVEMIFLHGHEGKTRIKWIDEKHEDLPASEKKNTKDEKKKAAKEKALELVAEQLEKAHDVLEEIKNSNDDDEDTVDVDLDD